MQNQMNYLIKYLQASNQAIDVLAVVVFRDDFVNFVHYAHWFISCKSALWFVVMMYCAKS